jgi:hypothetical protein
MFPVIIKDNQVSTYGSYVDYAACIDGKIKTVKLLTPVSGRDLMPIAWSIELRAPNLEYIPVLYSPIKNNSIIHINDNRSYESEIMRIKDSLKLSKDQYVELEELCNKVLNEECISTGIIFDRVLVEIRRNDNCIGR